MPSAAFALYRQFGFDVISTDGPIRGRNFGWSVSHIEVVPSGRPQLIAPFMSKHDCDAEVFLPSIFPRMYFCRGEEPGHSQMKPRFTPCCQLRDLKKSIQKT